MDLSESLSSMKTKIADVENAWSNLKLKLDILPPKFKLELVELLRAELTANVEAATEPAGEPKP